MNENNNKNINRSLTSQITPEIKEPIMLLDDQLKADIQYNSKLEIDESMNIDILLNNIKDFIILFSLFLFPSFNFNYLYLTYLLIGIFYNCYILENKRKDTKTKFYLQIFIIIYSLLLIIFKFIVFMIMKSNKSLIYNNKHIFINFGISFLINDKKLYYIITFITESCIFIMLLLLLLFNLCINITDEEIENRYFKKKSLHFLFNKMRNYLFTCFLITSGVAIFNKSIFSLVLLMPICLILFLYSLDIERIIIYNLFRVISQIYLFLLIIYILIINITNFYNISHTYFLKNKDFPVIWKQIGFYIAFYNKGENNLDYENFLGYFFSCLYIVILSFNIKSITKQELKIANVNSKDNLKKEENKYLFNKLYDKLALICVNPYIFLHICRIMAIIWLYLCRSFYSLGIFIWLYFSFIIVHISSTDFWTKIFLIPFISVSLFSIHISRIEGSFEISDEKKREKYFHFALGKYNNDYFKYIFCLLFYFFANYYLYVLNEFKKQIIIYKENKENNVIEIKNNNAEESSSSLNNLIINDVTENDISNNSNLIINDVSDNDIKNNNFDSNLPLENDINVTIEEKLKSKDYEDKKMNIEENKILKEDFEKLNLRNVVLKIIIQNIEKITIIAMYIIIFKNINIIHLIILLFLLIQLYIPEVIKVFSITNIQIFQILFLIEYIMDLTKVYQFESFKNNIKRIKFYLPYNEELNETSIEIFIYFLVYCFYIQYIFYNYNGYKQIEEHEDINIKNYIDKILYHYPIFKKILFIIGFIISNIYIWFLILLFILATCSFEINLSFGVELSIFLISIYFLMLFIQESIKKKLCLKFAYFLFYYSGIYNFCVYIYQCICYKHNIYNSKNFFINNLPNIGFSKYDEELLYKKILPHCLSNFISLLLISEMKRTIEVNEKKLLQNYINKIKPQKNIEKKENEEKKKDVIKKSAAQQYQENIDEMSRLNLKNFVLNLCKFITKFYLLYIYMFVCILFTTKYLSLSMIIYLIIFGMIFILTFYGIVNTLDNFFKKESYFISKLLRTSLIETKSHIQKNDYYREIAFVFLFATNCFYIILIYISGIFYLFENGCDPELLKGCDPHNQSFFSEGNKNKRDIIYSLFYLFGFFVEIGKNGILPASWAYILLFHLIGLDVYLRKLDKYFTNLSTENRIQYKNLANKNIKLKPLTLLGEENILANINNILAKHKILNANSQEINSIKIENKNGVGNDIDNFEDLEKNYKDLFENIENILKNKNIRKKEIVTEKEKYEAKKRIIQFLEIFKKASSYDVALSKTNNKLKIIKTIKRIYEETIIFLLIVNAIIKLNIWSFVYMIYSFVLILKEKSLKKYYVLFCFLIISIILQNIFFVTNINIETDPGSSTKILNIMEPLLNIPWYKKYTNDKNGFFLGLGVNRMQINTMWIDYIETIFIYIYLYYFTYSIYQDVPNKGKAKKDNDKINYYNLHLNEKVRKCVNNLSQQEFEKHQLCMNEDFNIDIGKYEDFKNKILLTKPKYSEIEMKEVKIRNSTPNFIEKNKNLFISNNKENKNNEIKNSIIRNDSIDKEKSPLLLSLEQSKRMLLVKNNLKNETLDENSPLLNTFKKIIYLSLHNVILIIITIISMMISGVISFIYIIFSLGFLIKSNAMYNGKPYRYPYWIYIYRHIILIDIAIQMLIQTPYISPSSNNHLYIILKIAGFNKIVDFGNKTAESFSSDTEQKILVLGKAFIYYFISLQILIYSSQDFQEFYLTYLLTKNINLRRIALMHVFRYNNKRIESMQHSITLREEMDNSMNILQQRLKYWSENIFNFNEEKDKKAKKKLIDKNDKIKKEKFNEIKDSNNKNSNDLEKNKKQKDKKIVEKEDIKNGEKGDKKILDILEKKKYKDNIIKENEKEKQKINNYVDEKTLKEKIKNWIFERIIMKIYLWFHKNAFSYNSMNEYERYIFEKEIIQGRTTITSMLESMVVNQLNTIDLNGFTSEELKEVKKYFDGTREKELKEMEKKKEKMEKLKKNIKEVTFINKLKKNEDNSSDEDKMKNKKSNVDEDKFKVLDKFISNDLFVKYLKTGFIIKCILGNIKNFCENRFQWLCYLVMIIDHMTYPSLLSSFYPLSIFLYAILESPRPKNTYWNICLIYTVFLISLKYFIQLELCLEIFKIFEYNYLEIVEKMQHYKIGLVYYETTFSVNFFNYIFYDSLVIIFLLLNNYILLSKGLWKRRENEIESIYQAIERVNTTKHLKLLTIDETKIFNFQWFSGHMIKTNKFKEIFSKEYSIFDLVEKKNLKGSERKTIDKNEKYYDDVKERDVHNIRPSFYQKIKKFKNNKMNLFDDITDNPMKPVNLEIYNENNRTYFQKLFPKIRNEKPGRDYFVMYIIDMLLIIVYLILFYTNMNQDKTFGSVTVDTNQFSSNMIFFLIIHVIFLFYDRVIYINQNRNNLMYDYIIYDKEVCAPISEVQFNELKNEISLKYNFLKRDKFVIPKEYINKIKDKYNVIYIQNEEFNSPLLQKYILHCIISIFSHIFIFFYLPMKGNYNIGNAVYCIDKENCNDFIYNPYLIYFYCIYIIYLFYSGLQIKYGFYDLRRTSILKSGNSTLNRIVFICYKAIPFIYEIKSAIDWTFTSTCLDYFQWNKFESVYDRMYLTYCEMTSKNNQMVGQKVNKANKIGIGFSLYFILILLLIIPIMLFSSLNPTNELNNLSGGTLKVDLSFLYINGASKNYTLFENSKPQSIKEFFPDNENDWEKYNYSKSIETKNFPHQQIQKVAFFTESDRNWNLAKPHILKLINTLDDLVEYKYSEIKKIYISMEYIFERHLPIEAQKPSDRIDTIIFQIDEQDELKNITQYDKIKEIIDVLKCNNDKVIFNSLYYVPLRFTANLNPIRIEDKIYDFSFDVSLGFKGCEKINKDEINYLESYFILEKINKKENETEGLVFHTFSDKASSSTSGYSVLTFYVSFILLAGNYVRNFFSGEAERINLTELPHSKALINLCEGVHVSRYSFDYEQEEKLYYILMELMRSPDYLKILTKSSIEQYEERKKNNNDNSSIIE